MRIVARHISGRTLLPARRTVASRTFPRFQSTSSTNAAISRVSSHLAIKLAGGGLVLVGGTYGSGYLARQRSERVTVYTWYQFSWIKKGVDASRAATAYLQQIATVIAASGLKSLNDGMDYLRTHAPEVKEGATRSLEQGWESVQQWVRPTPKGEDDLQRRMPDVKVLVKASQEHMDEAKKLAEETYKGILRVLEDKSKKA